MEISNDGEPAQHYSLVLTYSLKKFGEMFLKPKSEQGIYLLLLDKSKAFITGDAPLGWRSSDKSEQDAVTLPDFRAESLARTGCQPLTSHTLPYAECRVCWRQ